MCVVDDLNDFYSVKEKLSNLSALQAAGPVEFHQLDICDAPRLLKLAGKFEPEAIIHLAARAGVRPSTLHPALYCRVNVEGTAAVLEAARHCRARKVVFSSSSSVYGNANRVPFREDDLTLTPISPYAASRIAAEHLCRIYAELYSISITCLRLFTVYGPRQRPDLAIRKFAEKIEAGTPIPVYGDGASRRDYTYVEDTAKGIVQGIHYGEDFGIFNLGNSRPVDLNTLIRILERAMGITAVLDRHPTQPGDVECTYADISKAQEALGYAPSVSFEEGIARFVQWRRQSMAQDLPVRSIALANLRAVAGHA